MYYLTKDTIGIKYSNRTNEIAHEEYLKDKLIDGQYILAKKPHESFLLCYGDKTVTITDRTYVFLDTVDFMYLFFLEDCIDELHIQA
jgi:hypothetical protein